MPVAEGQLKNDLADFKLCCTDLKASAKGLQVLYAQVPANLLEFGGPALKKQKALATEIEIGQRRHIT